MRLTEIDLVIDRRSFLLGAGVSFLQGLLPRQASALSQGNVVLLSAAQTKSGAYCIVLFSERGETISTIPLPGRGHDVCVSGPTGIAVAFARRPAQFGVLFSLSAAFEPVIFQCPAERHFYGHGVFSTDGRLLYASENDFENAKGVVGIYAVKRRSLRRVGEFSTFGVGPHEILLLDDGRTLVVANGGIETHPDFGRSKLNLASMSPSIVFIDRQTGDLIEQHKLADELHHLSIRHMALGADEQIWFGCQHQGAITDQVPLVGSVRRGREPRLITAKQSISNRMKNYIGSVAASQNGEVIATSSPHGGVIVFWDAMSGQVLSTAPLADGCGLAGDGADFLASSGEGKLARVGPDGTPNNLQIRQSGFKFDNHMQVASVLKSN